MVTSEPNAGPEKGSEASQEHGREDGREPIPPSSEIWRKSCLERLCGPNPSLEERQNWYRWCRYHCTEHGVCKRKDPPGPF